MTISNVPITALPVAGTVAPTDILYVVTTPSTTPTDKAVTVQTLKTSINGVPVLAPTSSAQNTIQPSGDFIPLVLKADPAQTAPLQEWQSSAGAVLASVTAAGVLDLGSHKISSVADPSSAQDAATKHYVDLGANLPTMVGDTGTGGVKGLVPAPASGDAAKYLRGDATWQTVTAGGASDGVSVMDHGAVGNGVANDTAAITAAAAAAGANGLVHFPPGIYKVDSTVTPLAGQIWRGAGRTISFLKAGTVSNGLSVVTIASANSTISDLGFLGNNGIGGITAINSDVAIDAAPGAANLVVENCYFDNKNQRSIFLATGCDNARIQRNLSDGSAYSNTYETQANNGLFSECSILGSAVNAIELYKPVGGAQIVGNRIVNCRLSGTAAGIACVGDANTLIVNNAISGCGTSGIVCHTHDVNTTVASERGVIANNYLTGNAQPMLFDQECNGWTISGNQIEKTAATGITCYGLRNAFIGNTCYANTGNGILLANAGAQQNVLYGNRCIDNTNYGIVIEGPSNVIEANVCVDSRAGGARTQQIGLFINGVANNMLKDNIVTNNASLQIYNTGTSTRSSGNAGYNPLAITAPAVPNTGVAYTNAFNADATVYVSGGTVTAIAIGGVATGLTSGVFRVPVGETITITYSSVPSWVWRGD